jgi:cohesin complex subunit SA-1/2
MEVLSTYLLWKTLEATASEATTSPAVADLQAAFVERISEYTLSQHGIEATEAIRRASLKTLLDLRIVAQQRYLISQNPADLIEMDVQAQYRCAGFIQAQIERYVDMIKDSLDETEDDDYLHESDNEDEEAQKKQQDAGEKTKKYRPLTLEQQAAEYAFNDLISSFSRAICTDVIDLHHASTILAHYDSLGPFYNECGNQLCLALRHYGVLGGEGHAVAGVVFESLKQVS